MLEGLKPKTALTIKKYGYLIFLLPLLLPVQSYLLAQNIGYDTFLAFSSLIVVYVIVPIADLLLGKDPVNPSEDEVPQLSESQYYRWLAVLCFPLYLVCLFSSGYLFNVWDELTLLGQIGFVLSQGTVGAIIAINVGHELIHKNTKLEQISGGLLLSLVTYAGFKIEHVYGHHVNVSTPLDASSSRYNQSLYQFLPNAYVHNFLNAWKLQKKRLEKKGHGLLHWSNELIWYYLNSVLMAVAMGGLFVWAGGEFWMGVFFFAIQSFISLSLLEVVNYIEHYGLHRNKMSNGKYERVTPAHSWNSNYFLTNMFLFQLQRHSDHHAYAARRYQVLRHYDDSPQLPFGYATMVPIAFIPPLWKAIMNPRVDQYYKHEENSATA